MKESHCEQRIRIVLKKETTEISAMVKSLRTHNFHSLASLISSFSTQRFILPFIVCESRLIARPRGRVLVFAPSFVRCKRSTYRHKENCQLILNFCALFAHICTTVFHTFFLRERECHIRTLSSCVIYVFVNNSESAALTYNANQLI